MVNLTIRLGKAGASRGVLKQEPGSGTTPSTTKGASIPSHLADTDLPLLRGVGTVFSEPCAANFVGVKARRRPGDKVHICVRCDFPIAVYGRLIPCEHVFCLTCAKLDPTCFLCEERITRIQKMDVLEGIFICGAPGCLRSFLARPDFDLHISDAHSQLLQLEQGKLSPGRNVSSSNTVSEPQGQSHRSGQQHADAAGTLQVLLPREEEPQRKPPKRVRQEPQGVLARPIPELRLPDEFPHHRGGDQHMNRSNHEDLDPKPRRPKDWNVQISQGKVENEREQVHEGDVQSETWGSNHVGRRKERHGEYSPHQPSLIPSPEDLQKQKKRQQLASLPPPPPPPPYPPPSFPPAYLPQQEGSPSRFEANSRGFHSGMPLPYHEKGPRHRHSYQNSQEGLNQSGYGPPRPMHGNSSHENFGQNGPFQPHFHAEYGPSMRGHLPPPQPGPPPKRTKFSGPQEEPTMDYSWGPGNPGSFAGPPGGPLYSNWMAPANS